MGVLSAPRKEKNVIPVRRRAILHSGVELKCIQRIQMGNEKENAVM